MTTILCVEDDSQLLSLFQRVLEDQGFRVLTARGGRSAQKLLETNRVDLVITDIIMPEMDGVELIVRILELQPVPRLIAVSGGGHYLDGKSLLHTIRILGVEHTLLKPFGAHHLLSMVREAMASSPPRRPLLTESR